MTAEAKAHRLRALLARLATDCGGDVMALARPSSSGALDGFEWATGDAADTARAQRALATLARDPEAELGDDELRAFEAVVLPRNRPVAFVERGGYADFGPPWEALNAAAVRAALAPMFAAVGRLELPGHPVLPFAGTGFVVGAGLVMTNRHVAELFCAGLGSRRLIFRRGRAGIHFGRERHAPSDDADLLLVTDVVMVHPYWDMALLRVDGLAPRHAPLTLAARTPEALVGRDVVVIGYPARDLRNDAAEQDRIFARTFHVKRLQPGKLRDRAPVQSFELEVPAMVHDASTLAGNSGSAVIDVATMHVVGLHFGGIYLVANYAVPMDELARDPRVIAAGVRFAGAAAGIDHGVQRAWQRADDDREALRA